MVLSLVSEVLHRLQGIEKKRSTLHGSEKGVVARHEAGHAVVGTAVAKFIPGLTRVQVASTSMLKLIFSLSQLL